MPTPTMLDVVAARRRLARHLAPTPTNHYPAVDRATDATVFVKHENTNPTCAFKVRGGLNLLEHMPETDRGRGVIGYSTGNHAQSLAYAARAYGAPCMIVMPAEPNPSKARAVRDLGAELIEYGETFDKARAHAEHLADERGMRLVGAAGDPELIAGVGTAYLELFEQADDLDLVVVPVGGGSGAAAATLVARSIAPRCRVIGVQSAASPAAHDSWSVGETVERPNLTRAEGLATGRGFPLTQHMLRDGLADFVLVDDNQIRRAQLAILHHAHTVAEGAGAAGLAAVLAYPDAFRGRRIGVVCTGANASPAEIEDVVNREPVASSSHG